MDPVEDARRTWQKAKADLQAALSDLEGCVIELAEADTVAAARARVAARQEAADLHLQRYITRVGKS